MARIRLLTSVQGSHDAPVVGDVGVELDVADEVADVWADGERAERVPLVDLIKTAAAPEQQVRSPLPPVPAPVPARKSPSSGRRRRTRPAS